MIVLLNGEFVPESDAKVSVFDRGFLYGDGLFETLLIRRGVPFRWHQHMERFEIALELLKVRCPFDHATLRRFAESLVEKNNLQDAILRIHLSRGIGLRGYSPKGADTPTFVMSLHPAPAITPGEPPQWKLITARNPIAQDNPLAHHKSANKLHQVLARMEAEERGADEALLLNNKGEIAEATSANLFWIENGALFSPPSSAGALAGITRQAVIELASSAKLKFEEATAPPDRLLNSEGIFLTLTSLGLAAATSLDGRPLPQSPLIAKLHWEYWALVGVETNACLC